MKPDERLRVILLIEKMNANKDYSEKLGLEDISRFRNAVTNVDRRKQ